MQRIRVIATILSALAMVASLAGPAAANATAIITTGTAIVGKNATFCNHDGTSDVGGAGLGLPDLTEPKQAFYQFSTTVVVVNDATKGVKEGISEGTLNACGRLRWVGKKVAETAVGAACGMSKGYHGKGRIIFTNGPKAAAGFPHNTYSLHNITWKATAGGSIPFWASGDQGTLDKGAKGADLVTGTVNAQGGSACATKHVDPATGLPRDKDPNDSAHGATRFTVTGEFEVLNGQWRDPQDDEPALCKDSDVDSVCAYDSKKPQTPKQDG